MFVWDNTTLALFINPNYMYVTNYVTMFFLAPVVGRVVILYRIICFNGDGIDIKNGYHKFPQISTQNRQKLIWY